MIWASQDRDADLAGGQGVAEGGGAAAVVVVGKEPGAAGAFAVCAHEVGEHSR